MNSSFRIVAAAAILLVSDGHPAAATERGTAGQLKAARVIMLVLDGVRWQDFFDLPRSRLRPNDGRPHPFEGYWKKLSEGGVAFGNQTRGSTARMTLSSFFRQRKSLPSYQAMLAGFAQPCPDNDCARIEVETLPEAIARRLSLPPDEVAVIASWHGLERAAAHEPGTIHIDAGDKNTPRKSDGAPSTRSDERTAEIALNHLRLHSPRFLLVVFDAADHAAHEGNRSTYIKALREFDGIILSFFKTLEEMGPEEARRTTLIVTTDHGRGNWGPLWQYHSIIPNARDVFIAATGPHTQGIGHVTNYSRIVYHADLRPTIEILLGLAPSPCAHSTCGRTIPELTGENVSSSSPQ